MDERTELGDRPIPSRSRPSRRWRRLLTGAIALCAMATAVPSSRAGVSAFEPPPCAPLPDDGERLRALYLDLEWSPTGRAAPLRVRGQRWVCAELDPSPRSPIPRGPRFDLVSERPSSATLLVESSQGEVWEITLTRLDGAPLEVAAFASDTSGFFVNGIEWSEAGELAALDADFEVDRANGDSLRGRILWNAPWTPHEEPFVPLGDEDWMNAWPGRVSIHGPALQRLFGAPGRSEGVLTGTPDGTSIDSISFSKEAASDPQAAGAEVADDVARLSQSPPPKPTAARSSGGAAALWRAAPGSGERDGAAREALDEPTASPSREREPRSPGDPDSAPGERFAAPESPLSRACAGRAEGGHGPPDSAPQGCAAGPDPGGDEAGREDGDRARTGGERRDGSRAGEEESPAASGDLERPTGSAQPPAPGTATGDPGATPERAVAGRGDGAGEAAALRPTSGGWWSALRRLVVAGMAALHAGLPEVGP